jgi:hypothetical protein
VALNVFGATCDPGEQAEKNMAVHAAAKWKRYRLVPFFIRPPVEEYT